MSRKAKLRRALNQVRLTMVLLRCLLALSDDAADTYSQGFPEKFKKAWSANSGLFYCLLRPYLLILSIASSSASAAGHRHRAGISRPTPLPFGNGPPMPIKGEHGRGRRAVSDLGSRQGRVAG